MAISQVKKVFKWENRMMIKKYNLTVFAENLNISKEKKLCQNFLTSNFLFQFSNNFPIFVVNLNISYTPKKWQESVAKNLKSMETS